MSEATVNVSRRRGSSTRLWATASVIFNLALVAWLLGPAPVPTAASAPHLRPSVDPGATPPMATAAESVSDHTSAAPPFLWNQVDSSDPRQLMANLRAAGCPEEIVRDIIRAELLRASRQSYKGTVFKYWQPVRLRNTEDMAFSPEREVSKANRELFGTEGIDMQEHILTLRYLPYPERDLLFLPSNHRAAALDALTSKEWQETMRKFYYSQEVLFDKKLKLLAEVLSPDELEEFRLRNSPTARRMRKELQYFDSTPDEFNALLATFERQGNVDLNSDRNQLNRQTAANQIRTLFGEDRGSEFLRTTDPFYVKARLAVESDNLPVERADQAWQIIHEARTVADQAAKNSSLSPEERRRQLQLLESQADAELTQALSARNARGIIRDLHIALSETSASIHP